MNIQIKNFLDKQKEFSKIKDKIFEDIEKKGYCIVQLLDNNELARQLVNSWISDDYQIKKYSGYQEISSVIFFDNFIFYEDEIFYDIEIFCKKWNKQTAIIHTIFKDQYYGEIYKQDQNSINIIKYSIRNFFHITKDHKSSVLIYIHLAAISLLPALFIGSLSFEDSNIQTKRSMYVILGFFLLGFFIIFLSILNNLLKNILSAKKHNFILKKIEEYNKNYSQFNIFKRIDDNISSLKKLCKRKDILKDFEERLDNLNINQKKLEQSAKMLLQITNDIKIISQHHQNMSLQKTLNYGIKIFSELINNWIYILSDIQNQISYLNLEAKTDNQKLFVKTTDKLNSNISETIKQLEALKI